MSTPDPIGPHASTTSASSPSKTDFLIGGIRVTVHGLAELSPQTPNVAVLWLHHPRLLAQASMHPFASTILSAWSAHPAAASIGLICASFDQRNHGTRLQHRLYNEAWRQGNESHAPDMFSAFNGTQRDTSQLIDLLPGYVFPRREHRITQHLALGVSLGGHAVWHCLLHEPRVTAGVVVIGCPDYSLLMQDRARLSKRRSWTEGQGKAFFGSADFPDSLVQVVQRYDPAGKFLGMPTERAEATELASAAERDRLAGLLRTHLGSKRIQCLSGGADKLVPIKYAVPFMTWLKHAVGVDGQAIAGVGADPTAPSASKPPAAALDTKDAAWRAGAGSGWMVTDRTSPSSDEPPSRWKSADWKAGAGGGWMVDIKPSSPSSEEPPPSRWKSPDWKAGAGAGWMAGTNSGAVVEDVSSKASGTGNNQSTTTGATQPAAAAGWANPTDMVLEDLIFTDAGHEFTGAMQGEAVRFLVAALEAMAGNGGGGGRERARM